MAIIANFNDFGIEGPYQGQMQAALLRASAHQATVIDAMIDVPSYDIESAALLLGGIDDHLTNVTVFLCVVDPGVGSTRRAIYLKVGAQYYVGPDNGLFSEVIATSDKPVQAFEILSKPETPYKSFHGRDLFGPVAGKLAIGKPVESREIDIKSLVDLDIESKRNQIIYIDRFGNCWTGLRQDHIAEDQAFKINGHNLRFREVFSAAEKGESFWFINSSGFVEFAVNQGSAFNKLGLQIGQKV